MEIDEKVIEKIIRQVLSEKNGACTIKRFAPKTECIEERHRLNTGNPSHRVYTKDLLSANECHQMGLGVMEMEKTTFSWNLNYEEIDVVLEGTLQIIQNGQTHTAQKGEVLFIPRGSSVQFSVPDYARFIYITYPADWENQ